MEHSGLSLARGALRRQRVAGSGRAESGIVPSAVGFRQRVVASL